MLENAGLDDSTDNNILTVLVNNGGQSKTFDPVVSLQSSELNEISQRINAIQTILNKAEIDQLEKTSFDQSVINLIDTIQMVNKRCLSQSFKEAPALSFTFDNAISALKDIRSSILETIENPIAANLLSGNLKATHPSHRQYITPGTEPKKSTFCLACGEKGHWAKDRDCSLYRLSKKRGRSEQSRSDIRDFCPNGFTTNEFYQPNLRPWISSIICRIYIGSSNMRLART